MRKTQDPEIDLGKLDHLLTRIVTELNLPPGDIEVNLVDPETVQDLNKRYRGVDRPTNVIAFPHFEWREAGGKMESTGVKGLDTPPLLLGEVIVSVGTVFKDSGKSGESWWSELARICIHGILHVYGYDHQDDSGFSIMESMENRARTVFMRLGERMESRDGKRDND